MSGNGERGFSALVPRVTTAAFYGIVTLAALWWGPLPTAVLFGGMSAFAVHEFYVFRRVGSKSPQVIFGVVATAAMPVAAALWGPHAASGVLTALVVALMVRHMMVMRVGTSDTSEALFGAVYVGYLVSHIVLIRSFGTGSISEGFALALTFVLSVWAGDVAAYFIGTSLGRHRLAPKISPKKSWEGFYAGVAACVAVWMVAPGLLGSNLSWQLSAGAGVAVAIAAVVGDLFESRLKREMGVKDSGSSLPGHGGFLDRLDSVLLAGLVAYWVLVWGGVR